MASHQAPPSLGFSRQEHWSGLPFPSPMHESESEVAQSCPTLCDPMDCSLPGSSVHGIFQARVLEWGAIALITNYLKNTLKNPWTDMKKINGPPLSNVICFLCFRDINSFWLSWSYGVHGLNSCLPRVILMDVWVFKLLNLDSNVSSCT